MARGRQKAVRANGQATQERILQVAESMFAATGYEATSLRQIATAADIDIATLKYHFLDKPTLFGEVYRQGHEEFLEYFEPVLESLGEVETVEALRAEIDELVVVVHDFMEANFSFVRLTLYRLLEDSADIISIEEELQSLAISRVHDKLNKLKERGLVRESIDIRTLVVFLISSVSSFHMVGRVRDQWLGHPSLDTQAGRARSERFLYDLLERYLLEVPL